MKSFVQKTDKPFKPVAVILENKEEIENFFWILSHGNIVSVIEESPSLYKILQSYLFNNNNNKIVVDYSN